MSFLRDSQIVCEPGSCVKFWCGLELCYQTQKNTTPIMFQQGDIIHVFISLDASAPKNVYIIIIFSLVLPSTCISRRLNSSD